MKTLNSDVNNLIKKMPFEYNMLEEYDNVTYNIRFYMLSQQYQKLITKNRIENNKDILIKDEYKVIIAETGVSSKYNIEELSMKSVYNSNASQCNVLTTDLNMIIKEVNDCSLVNKITAISKLLGYESYINEPYHIDVWFSGYEHNTKKPISVIGDVLTYTVILHDVKTDVSNTGTVYNFSMTNIGNVALNKELNVIMNIGQFSDFSGTLDSFKNYVEKSINDYYFENNKQYESYYPNKDLLKINFYDLTKETYNDIFINNGDYIANNKLYAIDESGKNIAFDNNLSPKESKSSTQVIFKPDKSVTLDNIFQKVCFTIPELRTCIVRPIYKLELIDSTGLNMQLYKIIMNVYFIKDAFLDWFFNHSTELLNDKKEKIYEMSPEKQKEGIIQMQLNALNQMKSEKTLQKKYQYLFNGNDTNVLEMMSKIDLLWYLNIGHNDIVSTLSSDKNINNIVNITTEDNISDIKYDEYLNNIHTDFNIVRPLAKDKKLYLDDIYYSLSSTAIKELLTDRKILEKNDIFSPNNITTSVDYKNVIEQQIAQTGFSNMFGKSNLVELKLKILGDPYWLKIPSDNLLYQPSLLPESAKLHHFVYTMKTGLEQDSFSKTGYNINNISIFTGIYQIIESTSTFSDGKFVQELYGVIDNKFMHLANLEI